MIKEGMNKKAQGLSVNAIVLIVLGVVVLVVLIVGFTIGWAKILPFLSQSNVDTAVTQCEVACSTGAVFDYCRDRDINFGDDPRGELTVNCRGLEYQGVGLGSCSISSECYPRGAPESEVVTLSTEVELGKMQSTCKDDLKKLWRTPTKDTDDKNCESFKFGETSYFCCEAA